MPRPSLLPLALTLALAACSGKEDAAPDGKTSGPAPGAPPVVLSMAPQPVATAPQPETSPPMAVADARQREKQKAPAVQGNTARGQPSTLRRWSAFSATIRRCVSVSLPEREPCLAEARDAFRAARVDCAALSGRDRGECRKYAKLWADPEVDNPAAEATQDDAPGIGPEPPGDARPAERDLHGNRQARDAAGAAAEETRLE